MQEFSLELAIVNSPPYWLGKSGWGGGGVGKNGRKRRIFPFPPLPVPQSFVWWSIDITLRSLSISHVDFDYQSQGDWARAKNGGMKRNFPVIPIFRNFRWTSPKISTWNSGKCLLHSPTRNFQNIWSSGKRPLTFVNDIFTVVVCTSGHCFHRKSSLPSRDRTLRFFTGS